MRYDTRSSVAQVHELLEQWGAGEIANLDNVHEALPHLQRNHVSAALGLLSQPGYGCLERLERDGRLRQYRILRGVFTAEINHKEAYGFAPRVRGPHLPGGPKKAPDVVWKDDSDPDDHATIPDLIMSAAMHYEQGDKARAIEDLRNAYVRIRQEMKREWREQRLAAERAGASDARAGKR